MLFQVELENEHFIFGFGVISDIQYADREGIFKNDTGGYRYSRNGLPIVAHAFQAWSLSPCAHSNGTDEHFHIWQLFKGSSSCRTHQHNVDLIFQLGDIVDAWSKWQLGSCETPLAAVLAAFSALSQPVFHLWGNHDLYCFSRGDLLRHTGMGWAIRQFSLDEQTAPSSDDSQAAATQLGDPPATTVGGEYLATNVRNRPATSAASLREGLRMQATTGHRSNVHLDDPMQFPAYYSFILRVQSPHSNPTDASWRFIVLDTYEVAHVGYEEGTDSFKAYTAILEQTKTHLRRWDSDAGIPEN